MGATYKFGIIGAGNIARKFCEAVKLVDGVEVVAVSSKSSDKAKAFAVANNLDHHYSSYRDMLASDIDGVYIATTHNFHYENAMLCLEYNKPFLCEKCFMLTKAQATEVFALAKEKGLLAMEAMWSRFLPVINKAKEWITEGLLGDIDLATFLIGFKADKQPGSRMYEPSLAGGAMFDIGVYAIEIMTYLIDQPLKDLKAVITYADTGVDKVDSMLLQFEKCVASLNCIITASVPNELNIYGTEGRINIKNPHHSSECVLYDANGVSQSFFARLNNGFEYQIADFVEGVRAGRLESAVIPHSATLQCADIFDRCLKK